MTRNLPKGWPARCLRRNRWNSTTIVRVLLNPDYLQDEKWHYVVERWNAPRFGRTVGTDKEERLGVISRSETRNHEKLREVLEPVVGELWQPEEVPVSSVSRPRSQ